MSKWSAFLLSLIPAALAGYLCFLLVTIGLPAVDEMGTMFWGPLGAGFLASAMCILAPFGIAIFVKSAPKAVAAPAKGEPASSDDDLSTSDSQLLSGDEVDEFDSEEDDEFAETDFDDDFASSSKFETAEIVDDEFSDDELDTFADDAFEGDAFEDDDDDLKK